MTKKKGKTYCIPVNSPPKMKPLQMKLEKFHGLACPQYYLSNTMLLLKRGKEKRMTIIFMWVL